MTTDASFFGFDADADAKERRTFKRATTIFSGQVYLESEKIPGVIMDVSVTGVKIKTFQDVPMGAPVTLSMAGGVHFGGEVVWRAGDMVGLRFNKQPDSVASIMAGFLPTSYLESRASAKAA